MKTSGQLSGIKIKSGHLKRTGQRMAGLPLPRLTGGTREEGKVRRWRVNKEDGERPQYSHSELPRELWTNGKPHAQKMTEYKNTDNSTQMLLKCLWHLSQ